MIIDELIAILGYDIRGEAELKRFNAGLERTTLLAQRLATAMVAAGTLAAGALAMLGKSVIDVSADFEGFQASLETIEGSSDKAKKSLDWIADFAQKTPYEMAELTRAFIKLKNYGVDPTDGVLQTLGDTASAMNVPLNQAVEAFADAATFQFERLKEFGITTQQKGDQVTFSWTKNGKTMTKVVKKNGDEIRKFVLTHLGSTFGGAMIRQSKTWRGMMSNLADSWTMFQKEIGDGGFFENVKGRLANLLDYLGKLKADGTLGKWAKSISDAMTTGLDFVINTIGRMIKHFQFLSQWIDANPDTFKKVAAGLALIAGLKFPWLIALLALDDILSWMRGAPSVIGDFAESLSKLTGIDAGSIGTVLASLAAAAAAMALFGGAFGIAAKGLTAIATALGLLGGTGAVAGLGVLQRALGAAAIGAGTMAGLQYVDPKGNLGGLTSGADNWIRNKLGLAPKDTGVTPGEIWDGLFGKTLYNNATEQGDRRKQMEGMTTPYNPNTPGISQLFSNLAANNNKIGGGALQPVVNDNSNRSVTTNTSVQLTVQQMNEAANAAAGAVKNAVSSKLSSISQTPSRKVMSPWSR